jgi:hypothetical protein
MYWELFPRNYISTIFFILQFQRYQAASLAIQETELGKARGRHGEQFSCFLVHIFSKLSQYISIVLGQVPKRRRLRQD